MADLNSIQATEATRIVGSDATGLEGTPVKATTAGGLHVNLRDNSGTEIGIRTNEIRNADVVDTAGVNGIITVSTTPVAVRVGASNLANRKVLTADNQGTASFLYWGYSASVSPSNGTRLYRNQLAIWDAGPNITIYMVASSGSHAVAVTEAS